MRLSVCVDFRGKLSEDKIRLYNKRFRVVDIEGERLFRGVMLGYAFLPAALSKDYVNREVSNFVGAEICAIDIDNAKKDRGRVGDADYISYEDAIGDAFIQENALFVYETASSTAEWNRVRVVFWLPETVTTVEGYKKYVVPIAAAYGADRAPTSPVSMFYGGAGGRGLYFGKRLREAAVEGLVLNQQAAAIVERGGSEGRLALPSVSEIENELLPYIPKVQTYMDWSRVVSALANTYPFEAVRLVEGWSAGRGGEVLAKVRNPMRAVGIGTLIYLAKMYGSPYRVKVEESSPIEKLKGKDNWLARGSEIAVEPARWILDDFFARREVTWIWGAPSSGKTLLVQLLFLRQQAIGGLRWRHDENGGELFNLFYIAGKDTSMALLRQREEIVEHTGSVFYNREDIDLDVTNEKARRDFIELVKGSQVRIDAICFDTADNFAMGGDANDTRAAVLTMNAFGEIARACDVAVILIGHSNKSGVALQGNTKRLGGADHAWQIFAGKEDVYLLQRGKYRITANRNLSELKLKCVAGEGFVYTESLFEPKITNKGVDLAGILETMDTEFTESEFSKACGLPALMIGRYLRSLTATGVLANTRNKTTFAFSKRQEKEMEQRFGVLPDAVREE